MKTLKKKRKGPNRDTGRNFENYKTKLCEMLEDTWNSSETENLRNQMDCKKRNFPLISKKNNKC